MTLEKGVLYKENSDQDRLWKYYIFIDEKNMFVIDEKFKDFSIRYYEKELLYDMLPEHSFYKIDVNNLDKRRQIFLIKNILRSKII